MSFRVGFDDVIIDTAGNALSNVEAAVYKVGTSELLTIYSQREGGSSKSNPITTTSNGRVQFFVESSVFDVAIHDTEVPARFSDRTVTIDRTPGSGTGGQMYVANSSGLFVPTTMSGDATLSNTGALTIGEEAVTASKIGSGAVTAAKIGSGAVTEEKLGASAVAEAKLKSEAVSSGKLARSAKELFPQLTSATTRKINFGIVELPATGEVTSAVSVTHGLGTTPAAAVANMEGRDVTCATLNYNSTTFTVECRDAFGGRIGVGAKAHWIAIG